MPNGAPPPLGSRISRAELPVIAGLARGHTIAQIAETLGRSPLTIKTHIERLTHRTGMHRQPGIVGYAYRHHYLDALPAERRPAITLTRFQTTILTGLADGCTYAEIADRMFRSTGAIKAHGRVIFRALRATSGAHAVALAYQHGHLTIPVRTNLAA